MKLRTIISSLNLQNLTPELDTDVVITGCHISDIMSETLANAAEGELWITQQNHQVAVALAVLKRIPAILLVNGKKPISKMLEKAKEERIAILTTPMSCFETAGRLYQLCLSEKDSVGGVKMINLN
ncbi:serine kinase [Candidatus Aerophobetes bacterium]|nr:serine kinase [Candidatus Aerophobetes bacterium]